MNGTEIDVRGIETRDALRAAVGNDALFTVCVGGSPSYELRNYDYQGLAEAADYLFIMAYDMHVWDDYLCILSGDCSLTEAPYETVSKGVLSFTKLVPPSKLVLGLPWYGQRYQRIAKIPWNMGQIGYADVLSILASKPALKPELVARSQSWRVQCDGPCSDDPDVRGHEIWYDDATTLAKKYALAKQHGLRGVGMWNAAKLDFVHFQNESAAMWDAIAQWDE